MPFKPKLPLHEQKKVYQRELARLRKARSRKANAEAVKQQRKAESEACANLELLQKYIKHDPEKPGCWIWQGRWADAYSPFTMKPVMHVGQYGRMFADVAVWIASGHKKPRRGRHLKPSCGNWECVSPGHLYETSQSQQRARRILGLSG